MPSHDTKTAGELFGKIRLYKHYHKKWAKIHNKSNIWWILWWIFSSDQPKLEKIGNNMKFCNKPLQTRYMEAECFWAFKVAEQEWSFCFCDNINSLFYRTFPCEVSEKFSVGHTKMSYIVRHGLSEVLLYELVDDIKSPYFWMKQLLR